MSVKRGKWNRCFTTRQQLGAQRATLLLPKSHSRKSSLSSSGRTQGSKTRCLPCSTRYNKALSHFCSILAILACSLESFLNQRDLERISIQTYMLITNLICWDHLGQGAQNGLHKGRDKERREKEAALLTELSWIPFNTFNTWINKSFLSRRKAKSTFQELASTLHFYEFPN